MTARPLQKLKHRLSLPSITRRSSQRRQFPRIVSGTDFVCHASDEASFLRTGSYLSLADSMHSTASSSASRVSCKSKNVENEEPAAPSTLAQAVARSMPNDQATATTLQRTWHVPDLEKQRRLTLDQPAWKTELQRNQPPPSLSSFPVSAVPGLTPLAALHETEEERIANAEDSQPALSQACQPSPSTQRAPSMHWIRMTLPWNSGWTTRSTTSAELISSSKTHRSPDS